MSSQARSTFIALLFAPAVLGAQSLDLTIKNTGLSIGDSRFVRGIRINFRDDRMERVVGINATIWTPYEPARGTVGGLALGLPLTGARSIHGFGIGAFGVAADDDFTGLGIGGVGMGAGGEARGILIGGIGVGAGGRVTGLTIGGFGAGAGGDVKGITLAGFGAGAGGHVSGITIAGFGAGAGGGTSGITIAGFGAGSGGDASGLTIAGFGAGAGGNVKGITIAGFGAGAGGNVQGITIAGFGAGAGGDATGITLAGLGAGAGGTLRGFAASLGGAGAPRVRGIVVAGAAGGHDVEGGILAPLYFRIADDGVVHGVTVSSFNHIQGRQFGLSVGLLNYAWEAHGLQIGVLNYVADNRKGLRLLPLINRSWRQGRPRRDEF